MHFSRFSVLLIFSVLLACRINLSGQSKTEFEREKQLASSVTIYRDDYGVPHVYGATDEAAAFGFAYSEAEDNIRQIEDNFIRATGRLSEVDGKKALVSDWLNSAMQIPELSKKDYETANPKIKSICQGFADGLNFYLRNNPEVKPKLIKHFEPWYPLALIKYLYYQRGFLFARSEIEIKDVRDAFQYFTGLDPDKDFSIVYNNKERILEGSNSWAVSAVKSTPGYPLLLINPHLPFFGPSQVYEGHIMSKDGWNFSGYTRFGFPFPYVGFNENLGWASTDNYADMRDTYIEIINDSLNSPTYLYDDKYKKADEWYKSIKVKTNEGMKTIKFRFLKTGHGPVLGLRTGKFLSVKIAKYGEPGWLDEWYNMTKAQNLQQFKKAVSKLDMLFGNYLYADKTGNIFYVYNACVPIRDASFDWSKPVDGTTSATEWKGYHTMSELPQVLNPKSGWLQNCNGTPFLSTEYDNPKATDFPPYMVTEGDNERSKSSRRILSGTNKFTFEQWEKSTYDTHIQKADEDIPELVDEWKKLKVENLKRADEIGDAVKLLENWNRRSTIESTEMTLYFYWDAKYFQLKTNKTKDEFKSITALENAVKELKNTRGSWKVKWGNINRLQRVNTNGRGFSDDKYSIPAAGVLTYFGSIFTIWSNQFKGLKKRYGYGGNSYVCIVEFSPKIKSKSLFTFGESADPSSPHYFDQAQIYTQGKYKNAWLYLNDVKKNAEVSYHPGEK